MSYLPTLRLRFPDGALAEYRLNQNRPEYLTSKGTWRILDGADLQLHFLLNTEVAKWLMRESANASRTGASKRHW
jgi:hypothetical protein